MHDVMCRGMLTSLADPPRTITPVTFSSNVNATNGAVFFLQGEGGAQKDFSFSGKFLAYKNDTEGFTACEGDLDATVVSDRQLVRCLLVAYLPRRSCTREQTRRARRSSCLSNLRLLRDTEYIGHCICSFLLHSTGISHISWTIRGICLPTQTHSFHHVLSFLYLRPSTKW
jgi:hypothetical protein